MRLLATVLSVLLLSSVVAMPAHAQRAAPVAAPLVAGTDYTVLSAGQPWQPLKKDEIEVVEVYSYQCGHCARFAPMFDAWTARQPKSVRVVYMPAAFDPGSATARAGIAAQRGGLPFARVHAALFRAMHVDGTMPTNPSIEEYAAFMAPFGGNAARLAALMRAPATEAELKRANAFQKAAEVTATPTLIVNGKYAVLGRSHEEQISILNRLIAQIRGGKL